uniref:DUF4381 domain-containing protein n=1 Tax=uncultured Alphaproteobacteria bacterium TaxID=91750 RepID=A0A6G8F2U6_9PROT|nr:hypothetical protein PlAlph_4860 [uncultured Alphaproteobacteria bacterium]
MENNLPELRDIHLPAEGISIWPLAWGWWLIAAFIAVLFCGIWLYRLWQRKSKKLYALKLLSGLDGKSPSAAVKLSEILRRICIYKYPQASSLSGQEWIDFLNSHGRTKLEGGAACLLLEAPYVNPQTSVYNPADFEKLKVFCRSWIGENL